MNSREYNRAAGAMYGFAIGDAMGATTEFMTEEQIDKQYGKVTDIIGGGWLGLEPGQVTDDTEMMLCVCRALARTAKQEDSLGYNFMCACRKEFINWFNSKPKDVGGQCSKAIWAMMNGRVGLGRDENALGNGALMRALPCALLGRSFLNEMQGRMTHNSSGSSECVSVYHDNIVRLVRDSHLRRIDRPMSLLDPKGFVYNTLNNALYWASTCSSFEEAIIGAVNHGGDADTIAALAGGLAGARFGLDGIPGEWCAKLDKRVVAELAGFIEFADHCDRLAVGV